MAILFVVSQGSVVDSFYTWSMCLDCHSCAHDMHVYISVRTTAAEETSLRVAECITDTLSVGLLQSCADSIADTQTKRLQSVQNSFSVYRGDNFVHTKTTVRRLFQFTVGQSNVQGTLSLWQMSILLCYGIKMPYCLIWVRYLIPKTYYITWRRLLN